MTETERRRFAALIRESSRPLLPVPVELPPEWETAAAGGGRPAGIRAALFDLYGTLFVSAAGEIAADEKAAGRIAAAAGNEKAAGNVAALTRYFRAAVSARHETAKAAAAGAETFPEIRAEEIWTAWDGPIPAEWGKTDPRETALRYELAVNPVYPMPGALETINALRRGGVTLGIISNAQFFSPLLFNAFFGKTAEELGFDPRLLIWSFEEGEAKPSPRLFQKAAAVLAEKGIRSGEALFTGNDMRNDILPAAEAGFVTALFAGDRRSLRLRDAVPAPDRPSTVITALSSLVKIR